MNVQFCAFFQDGNRIRQRINGLRDMKQAVSEVKHQLGLIGTKCERTQEDGCTQIFPASGRVDSVAIEVI